MSDQASAAGETAHKGPQSMSAWDYSTLGIRPRARDLGVIIGRLTPGETNSIIDVSGVMVGHVTLSYDSPTDGIIRTGVTAVTAHEGNLFREKVWAAAHVINGFGKSLGLSQIQELGFLETPIVLTNTLSVGTAFQAIVQYTLEQNPDVWTVNPVVGECNDRILNDIRSPAIGIEHVLRAIGNASDTPTPEGAVGAGTGMSCYGWKGGIGTSSRRIRPEFGGFVIGILVLSNFGLAEDLVIDGVAVGRSLVPPVDPRCESDAPNPAGSCIVILATNAPVSTRQLGRLARRVQTGLARTGTFGEHASGEYVFAFSTSRSKASDDDRHVILSSELTETGPELDELFRATVEATEEAVINSLFTAHTVYGVDDHVRYGLPISDCLTLLGVS